MQCAWWLVTVRRPQRSAWYSALSRCHGPHATVVLIVSGIRLLVTLLLVRVDAIRGTGCLLFRTSTEIDRTNTFYGLEREPSISLRLSSRLFPASKVKVCSAQRGRDSVDLLCGTIQRGLLLRSSSWGWVFSPIDEARTYVVTSGTSREAPATCMYFPSGGVRVGEDRNCEA